RASLFRRLFRGVREGHTAHAADLRHRPEPRPRVCRRVSPLGVHSDHPAGPSLPLPRAPAPARSACCARGRRRRVSAAARVAAHAKVNLFLRILAREAGGFHQIETAFALLELADELVVRRTAAAGDVALTVHGPDLGPAEENLAVRAARLVLQATGNRFGGAIALTKRI